MNKSKCDCHGGFLAILCRRRKLFDSVNYPSDPDSIPGTHRPSTNRIGKRRRNIEPGDIPQPKRLRLLNSRTQTRDKRQYSPNDQNRVQSSDIYVIREARRRLLSCDEDSIHARHLLPPLPPSELTHVDSKFVPLSALDEKDLLDAWLDCVQCHFSLWRNGIEYWGISTQNVLWDSDNRRGILSLVAGAVLIDGKPVVDEFGRAASKQAGFAFPFMARGVLSPRSEFFEIELDGRSTPHRLYRHILESFVWLLTIIYIEKILSKGDDSGISKSTQQSLLFNVTAWKTELPTVAGCYKTLFVSNLCDMDIDLDYSETWRKVSLLLMLVMYRGKDEGKEANSLRLYEAVTKIIEGEVITPEEVSMLDLAYE